MKQLSVGQVGKMMFLGLLSMKLMIFPAVLTTHCGKDGKIAITILLLMDLLVFFLYVAFIKKHPHWTIRDLMQNAFGVWGSRLFFGLLFVFYLAKCLFVVKQAHIYLVDTLVEEQNWIAFAVPLLLLMGFAMAKGRISVARTTEFLFFIVWVSLALTLLIPLSDFRLTNVLPLLEGNVSSIFSAVLRVNFILGDYSILLLFWGKMDWQDNSAKVLIRYALCGVISIVIFYIIFYGVFGDLGVNYGLAISDLPLSSIYPSTMGRLDWLTVIGWLFILLLIMCILFLLAKESLDACHQSEKRYISIITIVIAVALGMILLYFDLELFLKIVTSGWFVVFSLIFQIVIPAMVTIAYLIVHVKNKKTQNKTSKNEVKV